MIHEHSLYQYQGKDRTLGVFYCTNCNKIFIQNSKTKYYQEIQVIV
jgi:hypothetical protein